MLKPWANNRKRREATAQTSAVGWRERHRLGFEAMEGRLLLSGDAPDFVSWDSYSPELKLAIYQLSAAPLQTAPVETMDGGLILPGAVLSGSSAHVTFDSVTNRANFGSSGLAPTTGVFNNSGSGGLSFDFSGVHLDTPAIPVIVFPGADSDVGTTFVDQPADAGPQPVEVTVGEGGAIPINSILAFVGHADSWKSGERLASTAASQTGISMSAIPNLLQPTQAGDISGEWARPTMLEMAGGEPANKQSPEASQRERPPLSDGDDDLRSRRSWSPGAAADSPANNSQAARETNPSRNGADALPSEDVASVNRRLSLASKQPVSLILASHVADAHPLVALRTFAKPEAAKFENDSASKSGANESAYAEVYDQLGTSDAGGAQPAFKLDSWRDSWKATPLLMILALERIAASNTRRAKRESPCQTGRSQSHALATTDPTGAV